ncbi:MAG: Tat pathway signal sequence domain protein [Caulobacterales bacterium]|nr:Tat pathway signal sequence domain protein [Caulobacterales bacterium]
MSARASVRFIVVALAGLAAGVALSGCASDEPNAGPCPRAYALYDVSRSVEFVGGGETYSAVGFTAEIENVETLCRYAGEDPIEADLQIDIGFGRGPAATGNTHEYRYFIAVTRRDSAVIAKQIYPIQVTFPKGVDRVYQRETIDRIVIPRKDAGVSGSNFEIIVGMDVTATQLQYNRDGKRFTAGAGR